MEGAGTKIDPVFLQAAALRDRIDLRAALIALFVILSFTVKFLTVFLKSYLPFSLALAGTGLLFIFFLPMESNRAMSFFSSWLLTSIYIFIKHLGGKRHFSDYLTLFILFTGMVLLAYSGKQSRAFRLAFSAILGFSHFYAASVWVQVLLPGLYNHFLALLPEANRAAILKAGQEGAFYTGFSSNAGFTAGHIVCGILVLLTGWEAARKRGPYRIGRGLGLAFLALSLLMTGRRAHILFLLMALAGLYILPYRGARRISRLAKTLFASLTGLVAAVIFMEPLSRFPFFSRFNQTIRDFLMGQDVSTGRRLLYQHAWRSFLSRPLLGIGWGEFRYTTIGQVTIKTEMEVHNIYLQLLTEAGILGLFFLGLAFYLTLQASIRGIHRARAEEGDKAWLPYLRYSLAYQLFFLLYGLTSNPLYEPIFLMMYFFAAAISLAYARSWQHKSREGLRGELEA